MFGTNIVGALQESATAKIEVTLMVHHKNLSGSASFTWVSARNWWPWGYLYCRSFGLISFLKSWLTRPARVSINLRTVASLLAPNSTKGREGCGSVLRRGIIQRYIPNPLLIGGRKPGPQFANYKFFLFIFRVMWHAVLNASRFSACFCTYICSSLPGLVAWFESIEL